MLTFQDFLGVLLFLPTIDAIHSAKQSIFCAKQKFVKGGDYSFVRSCSITSSCKFSSKTLFENYITDNASVFWIGESVLQHSFLSFLNLIGGNRVKRHVMKGGVEYCTVHGTSLKTTSGILNLFMIRSQGIYDKPVNDTLRWVTLRKQGVSYKDQFIAHDKFELAGCFKDDNLEEKMRKIFEFRKVRNRIVYVQLGLWDVCFSANDQNGFEVKLRSLLKVLKTESRLFVGYMTAMHNSLPQHEKRYNDSIVGRVRPYNRIIRKICRELDISLLTLTYSLTQRHADACIDGVHYNEFLSTKLALTVRKFISRCK